MNLHQTEVKTTSPSQTAKTAQSFAKQLKGGDVVALYGDLGAGKTVFVQGLAQALGIKKRVLSPTFVFVRSYPLTIDHKPLTFYHVDLYRGQNISDFKYLGLDEIFNSNSIVVIEWADKIKDSLPKKRYDIFIKKIDEKTRKIKIMAPSVILSPSTVTLSGSEESQGKLREGSHSSKNLKKAAQILKGGGVVVFPTDTVYGIGCRWDDKKAQERIFQIKKRDKSRPLPILVSNVKQVEKIAIINDQARKLIDTYWPGGLTIIMETKAGKKLGFRMPKSDLVQALINKVGMPITGTSANLHGKKSVNDSRDLDQTIISQVDYVLKGKCERGVESTVVDATVRPPKIIRQGVVKLTN